MVSIAMDPIEAAPSNIWPSRETHSRRRTSRHREWRRLRPCLGTFISALFSISKSIVPLPCSVVIGHRRLLPLRRPLPMDSVRCLGLWIARDVKHRMRLNDSVVRTACAAIGHKLQAILCDLHEKPTVFAEHQRPYFLINRIRKAPHAPGFQINDTSGPSIAPSGHHIHESGIRGIGMLRRSFVCFLIG